MPEVEIRRAGINDLHVLVQLLEAFRACYEVKPAPEACFNYLKERLSTQDSVIFIALHPSAGAVGFAQLFPSYSSVSLRQFWRLHDLYVAESFRKQGISKALLAKCKEQATGQKSGGLIIETRITGKSAEHFFDAVGFRKEGDHLYYFIE